MAKVKENPSGFNRKKYMELKKADPQTVQDYVNTIFMRGYARGSSDGYRDAREAEAESFDAMRWIEFQEAMEEIRKIPRIGKKADEIEKILREALNIGMLESRTA